MTFFEMDNDKVIIQYINPIIISKKTVLFLGGMSFPSLPVLPRNAPIIANVIHGNSGYVPVRIKCFTKSKLEATATL